MRITFVVPPSRLPTVALDPGPWWERSTARGHTLRYWNVNCDWWAGALGSAIDQLRDPGLTGSLEALEAASDAVCARLRALNSGPTEFTYCLHAGARVTGLDYANSLSLLAAAQNTDTLRESIAVHCRDLPPADLYLFRITSEHDLLTGMIVALELRQAQPDAHICLFDHGYENFTLRPHLTAIAKVGALELVFDTIVAEKSDADAMVDRLVAMLERNELPSGVLALSDREAPVTLLSAPGEVRIPAIPTAMPEPVFWTRLSARSCYWGRCAFCVQNNKIIAGAGGAKHEIEVTLDRLEHWIAVGYRNVIFSDEALSPAILLKLSERILARGLHFRWACRSKLELNLNGDLFRQMAASGCYEVLYGMESTDANTLQQMDKFTLGLDDTVRRRIFADMASAGIGAHVNLIAGFPGDDAAALRKSARFVADSLRGLPNATFLLNQFQLFPDVPIERTPERFGIIMTERRGDMSRVVGFKLTPELEARQIAALDAADECEAMLIESLGWSRLTDRIGDGVLAPLYFGGGLGAILKAQAGNPLDPAVASDTRNSGAQA